jgi:hypothetical protein
MKRAVVVVAVMATMVVFTQQVAWAGSPHFVDSTVTCTSSGNTLTCSGKEAGLGDEAQVHIVVSATAECINPGGNHPQAGNKESFSAEGDFPVQNGKANFSLTLTATFKPDCSPPMTVQWSDVTVTDTTNGISVSFPGPI